MEHLLRARQRGERGAGTERARESVLLFRVGEGTYGIEARALWEVLLPDGVTGLPTASDQAVSTLAYRGRRLPLIRLGELFGTPGDRLPAGARVLLVHGRRSPLGLLVDEVLGMVGVDASRVASLPALATVLNPRFFCGLFKHQGRPVLLVSAEGLGEFDEIAQFSTAS
jgi:chemotaxis signal transduction protein